MVRPTERALHAAWRALAGGEKAEGWRTIPIGSAGSCHVLAGRHFQGGEEAVLIGCPQVASVPDDIRLPRGRGFRVELVKDRMSVDMPTWIAIVRQPAGSETMFTRMVEDVIALLRGTENRTRSLLQLFTGRIRAWQAFMEEDRKEVLTSRAEIGLVGELVVLQHVLDAGVVESAAVEGWRGPLDGLHDFAFGTGAMEVKASVTSAGFPAVVGSLGQLDDAFVKPLYLVGIRLSLGESGRTLPEIITVVRNRVSGDDAAQAEFDDRVLRAGFLASSSRYYQRRFGHVQTSVFRVGEDFPRLTPNRVDRAIRGARYELDLDLVDVPKIAIDRALAELQVIRE